MAPLPTIVVLWDSGVHRCASDCGDMAAEVEGSVKDGLGLHAVL